MTTYDRYQIIAAAKEAGITYSGMMPEIFDSQEMLERFANIMFEAGRKAENEACELACAEIRVIVEGNHQWTALHVQEQCIDAIRARATK